MKDEAQMTATVGMFEQLDAVTRRTDTWWKCLFCKTEAEPLNSPFNGLRLIPEPES